MQNSASDIVSEREGLYGHPFDNFRVISDFWNVYLVSKGMEGPFLNREDVAHMMILLKVARTLNPAGGGDDSITDIAGYAQCALMIREKEREGEPR